jgi:hypothetical protein
VDPDSVAHPSPSHNHELQHDGPGPQRLGQCHRHRLVPQIQRTHVTDPRFLLHEPNNNLHVRLPSHPSTGREATTHLTVEPDNRAALLNPNNPRKPSRQGPSIHVITSHRHRTRRHAHTRNRRPSNPSSRRTGHPTTPSNRSPRLATGAPNGQHRQNPNPNNGSQTSHTLQTKPNPPTVARPAQNSTKPRVRPEPTEPRPQTATSPQPPSPPAGPASHRPRRPQVPCRVWRSHAGPLLRSAADQFLRPVTNQRPQPVADQLPLSVAVLLLRGLRRRAGRECGSGSRALSFGARGLFCVSLNERDRVICSRVWR